MVGKCWRQGTVLIWEVCFVPIIVTRKSHGLCHASHPKDGNAKRRQRL